MKLKTKKGIVKTGTKENVFDEELCNKIRKRLHLSKKELPDSHIRKVVNLSNSEIGKWIIENAEGFVVEADMGVLAPSKHMPKELRENKETTIDKITYEIPVSPLRRKQLLERYNIDIGRRINGKKLILLKEKIPFINLHSYFYTFRLMWFNHRNCPIRKARSYEFKPTRLLNRLFFMSIINGKDYYEWNFNDFYSYKVKAE